MFVKAKTNTRTKDSRFFTFTSTIVTHPHFTNVIIGCIVFNAIVLGTQYAGMSREHELFVGVVHYGILVVFSLEAAMMIYVYGFRNYMDLTWNKIDLAIVVLSWLTTVVYFFWRSLPLLGISRLLRVFRALRLFERVTRFRVMVDTIVIALPSVFNISLLLFIVTLMYTFLGKHAFGNTRYQLYLHKRANFRSFGVSWFALFSSMTLDGWSKLMYDCQLEEPLCERHASFSDCGYSIGAGVYFITYYSITYFILLNLFIVVLLDYFARSFVGGQAVLMLLTDDIASFANTWTTYDSELQETLASWRLRHFLRRFAITMKTQINSNLPYMNPRLFAEVVLFQLHDRKVKREVLQFKGVQEDNDDQANSSSIYQFVDVLHVVALHLADHTCLSKEESLMVTRLRERAVGYIMASRIAAAWKGKMVYRAYNWVIKRNTKKALRGAHKHEGARWQKSTKLLGKGNFGAVYEGLDRNTGQIVAIKRLNKEKGAATEFLKEVKLLSELQHPNVVNYLGSYVERGAPHLVMEFVPCGSLEHLLNSYQYISLAALRVYAIDILTGLEYLHSHGILHRDIKPANILLDQTGKCKLADFGIAKAPNNLPDAVSSSTKSSAVGTPAYMSPESIKGHPTTASDVWALGLTLLELATGDRPWAHLRITQPITLLIKIANTKDTHPISNGLPPAFQDFIGQCLQHDYKQRPTVTQLKRSRWIITEAAYDTSYNGVAPRTPTETTRTSGEGAVGGGGFNTRELSKNYNSGGAHESYNSLKTDSDFRSVDSDKPEHKPPSVSPSTSANKLDVSPHSTLGAERKNALTISTTISTTLSSTPEIDTTE